MILPSDEKELDYLTAVKKAEAEIRKRTRRKKNEICR